MIMPAADSKILILKMLGDGSSYVSGRAIGEALGMSRTAVWKHILELRSDGYAIEAVTNKGYRLAGNPAGPDEAGIRRFTDASVLGTRIVCLDEAESTNSYAKELAAGGASDGTVVTAGKQTAGRGRLGRKWVSGGAGESVCMSVVLRPQMAASESMLITLAAGVAVCRALRKLIPDAGIKWPNDIVSDGKKVCGILAEMTAEENRVSFIVVGIGINANQKRFPDDIAGTAVSVLMRTGTECDRNALIGAVLTEFDRVYTRLHDGHKSAVIAEYRSMCVTIRNAIKAETPGGPVEGFCEDISDNGELIMRTAAGTRMFLNSGEVSVRGLMGYS